MPALTAADTAPPPALTLPLACHAGVDCFVQNYVDHPGAAPRDHRCGSQTYAGHDGTDFRLPTLAILRRGVAVLAAATGTVRALREGVTDRLIATAADHSAVAGRECGNGVVIDHPGGWQSQYCHMAKGSVAVSTGQRVAAGAKTPVLISIHGGPEGQEQPSFNPRRQSWVNELGAAVIIPNVRGSSGYGKTYMGLDNAAKRDLTPWQPVGSLAVQGSAMLDPIPRAIVRLAPIYVETDWDTELPVNQPT